MSIGQAGVPPLGQAQDPGSALSLVGPELGAASGPRLTGGEVQDGGPVSCVHRLEQGTGAGKLDVIAVGGDCKNVDGHGGNKAVYAVLRLYRFARITAPQPKIASGPKKPSEAITLAVRPTKLRQAVLNASPITLRPG